MSGDQLDLDAMLLGRALDAVEAIDAGDLTMIRRGAARRLAAEDVPALVAEVRRLRAQVARVEAYAKDREAYGRRGRTVHSARIASDLLAIVGDGS